METKQFRSQPSITRPLAKESKTMLSELRVCVLGKSNPSLAVERFQAHETQTMMMSR